MINIKKYYDSIRWYGNRKAAMNTFLVQYTVWHLTTNLHSIYLFNNTAATRSKTYKFTVECDDLTGGIAIEGNTGTIYPQCKKDFIIKECEPISIGGGFVELHPDFLTPLFKKICTTLGITVKTIRKNDRICGEMYIFDDKTPHLSIFIKVGDDKYHIKHAIPSNSITFRNSWTNINSFNYQREFFNFLDVLMCKYSYSIDELKNSTGIRKLINYHETYKLIKIETNLR